MLKKNTQSELSMSPYNQLFDILIEEDNFWRLLKETIDFSFIVDLVEDTYSDAMGRTAQDPIRMFFYILLKAKFKLSDVDLVARTKTDMLFKYFLGYDPEELNFINPSSLSKFRRLHLVDTNLIDELLKRTVELALEEGIIEKKVRLIMDSTHTNAMFQSISPREELIKRAKDVRKAIYAVDSDMKNHMPKKRESSGLLEDQIDYCKELLEIVDKDDVLKGAINVQERKNYLAECLDDIDSEVEYARDQDAKIGHKTADTSFFGYKTHIAMTPERIIVAATITSGEKHDGKQLQPLIEKSHDAGVEVEAVIGDGAYSEKENLSYCEENEIELASKLSKTVTHGSRQNQNKFEYNKDAGMYVCEAGHMSIKKVRSGSKKSKEGSNTQVEAYFFDVEKCKYCQHKDGCYKEGAKTKSYSVKIKEPLHTKQMDYMESERFQELYQERYKIEAKNAELKNSYGYDTATGCGLLGMTIQGASVMFLSNMKRIIKMKKENSKDKVNK